MFDVHKFIIIHARTISLPRGSVKRLIRLMILIPWVYSNQKQASEGCKKPLRFRLKSFWGAFPEFPFLMLHMTSPRSLIVCWGYPNGIASRCLINMLPDFFGLHSCPCNASDKFNQLEWVGLEGHFATNLYKNLTVIERSVVITKYQALSQLS